MSTSKMLNIKWMYVYLYQGSFEDQIVLALLDSPPRALGGNPG
jgi:hypothetical protein